MIKFCIYEISKKSAVQSAALFNGGAGIIEIEVRFLIKLIVGLGNPGKQYEHTKHNVGFMTIDEIAKEKGVSNFQKKFNGVYAFYHTPNGKVYLLKPETYMNLSGECMIPFMNYFQIADDEVVVVYDDLDIAIGRLRLRESGSAGGHNGIKSIIAHIGHQKFKRVRIGISRPTVGTVVDYVLSPFAADKQEEVQESVKRAAQAVIDLEDKSFSDVMNIYNQKQA